MDGRILPATMFLRCAYFPLILLYLPVNAYSRSYLYSEVFSADMFAKFKREGVMSRTLGKVKDLIANSRSNEIDYL